MCAYPSRYILHRLLECAARNRGSAAHLEKRAQDSSWPALAWRRRGKAELVSLAHPSAINKRSFPNIGIIGQRTLPRYLLDCPSGLLPCEPVPTNVFPSPMIITSAGGVAVANLLRHDITRDPLFVRGEHSPSWDIERRIGPLAGKRRTECQIVKIRRSRITAGFRQDICDKKKALVGTPRIKAVGGLLGPTLIIDQRLRNLRNVSRTASGLFLS